MQAQRFVAQSDRQLTEQMCEKRVYHRWYGLTVDDTRGDKKAGI